MTRTRFEQIAQCLACEDPDQSPDTIKDKAHRYLAKKAHPQPHQDLLGRSHSQLSEAIPSRCRPRPGCSDGSLKRLLGVVQEVLHAT
jgi:hypothetical protein